MRRIAEAATRGPWGLNPIKAQVDEMNTLEPVCALLWPTELRTEEQTIANGEHVAAFDPPTVLALLDEIEKLRQELAVLKPVYDEARMGSCGDCDQAMREAPMRDEDEVLGPCDVCEEMYAAVERAEAYYWRRDTERGVGA